MESSQDFFAPFYAGQRVVACHPHVGSAFINGNEYTIAACEYKINPANGKGPFWYVGIEGHKDGLCWFNPKLFVPYTPPMKEVTFEKIVEQNPVSVN